MGAAAEPADAAAARAPRVGTDACAWCLNVSTSVLIVFANKVLLDSRTGHGFAFATTLCGMHFMACAVSVWAVQALGLARRASLPWVDVLRFAVVASTSIGALNLSLLINSVGFYQVTKLLIIPCVCVLERALQHKPLTAYQTASIAAVVLGVGIVTVTDVHVTPLGLLLALTAVLASGLQQVMCGALQRKHRVSSHQLLSNTAHVQGAMLLAAGPFVDQLVCRRWVLDYAWQRGAVAALGVSCGLAVLVNVSQFMCLGRFSAVSFQVLGHAKTVLVLLASWLLLQEPVSMRKLLGMCLAVAGMAAYGDATARVGRGEHTSGSSSSSGDAGASKQQPLLRPPAAALGRLASFPIRTGSSISLRVSDSSSNSLDGMDGGGAAAADDGTSAAAAAASGDQRHQQQPQQQPLKAPLQKRLRFSRHA